MPKDRTNFTDRTDRTLETRENESRTMTWKPPTLLPEPEVRDGVRYGWIRKSTLGDIDHSNWSQARRDGWEPVKKSDHPELMMARSDSNEDMVEVGGLVLCQTSEEYDNARRRYYDDLNRRQVSSIDQQFKATEDHRVPLFSESRSETQLGGFGRGK